MTDTKQDREYAPGPVLAAVPALSFMWTTCVQSIMQLYPALPAGSSLFVLDGINGYANARNVITQNFLNSPFAWLLTIDSDHTFPSDVAQRLQRHRKPYVACPYVARCPPHALTFQPLGASAVPTNGLIEVAAAGMGCVLIHRSVFDRIGAPWFREPAPGLARGEDYDFADRLRANGIPINVDLDTPVGHVHPMALVPTLGSPTSKMAA